MSGGLPSSILYWILLALGVVFLLVWLLAFLFLVLLTWAMVSGSIQRVRRVMREGWGIVRSRWAFLFSLLCAATIAFLNFGGLIFQVIQGVDHFSHGWANQFEQRLRDQFWWASTLWSLSLWGYFQTASALAPPPEQPPQLAADTDPQPGGQAHQVSP